MVPIAKSLNLRPSERTNIGVISINAVICIRGKSNIPRLFNEPNETRVERKINDMYL